MVTAKRLDYKRTLSGELSKLQRLPRHDVSQASCEADGGTGVSIWKDVV